jgi:hypothetical protein
MTLCLKALVFMISLMRVHSVCVLTELGISLASKAWETRFQTLIVPGDVSSASVLANVVANVLEYTLTRRNNRELFDNVVAAWRAAGAEIYDETVGWLFPLCLELQSDGSCSQELRFDTVLNDYEVQHVPSIFGVQLGSRMSYNRRTGSIDKHVHRVLVPETLDLGVHGTRQLAVIVTHQGNATFT